MAGFNGCRFSNGQPIRRGGLIASFLSMKYIVKQVAKLPLTTGKLNICDPMDGQEPEFDVPCTDHAKIFAISSPLDMLSTVALEIAFVESDHNFSRKDTIGRVGVDSASIAVSDRCLTDALENILELQDVPPSTVAILEDKLQLKVRHLYDCCYEILESDLKGAYARLTDFFHSELDLNPDETIRLYENYDYLLLDRICRCTSPIVPLGDFEFFVFNTGSDGLFDILGEQRSGLIQRCWIMLNKNAAPTTNLEFEEVS